MFNNNLENNFTDWLDEELKECTRTKKSNIFNTNSKDITMKMVNKRIQEAKKRKKDTVKTLEKQRNKFLMLRRGGNY